VVFDGFAGSGTTLLACESLGRIYRGVEIDPLYVDVIVRRWQAQTGRQATLLATGETFDALAVSRSVAAPNPHSAVKPLRRGR
jgi:DNA modification methylase